MGGFEERRGKSKFYNFNIRKVLKIKNNTIAGWLLQIVLSSLWVSSGNPHRLSYCNMRKASQHLFSFLPLAYACISSSYVAESGASRMRSHSRLSRLVSHHCSVQSAPSPISWDADRRFLLWLQTFLMFPFKIFVLLFLWYFLMIFFLFPELPQSPPFP